MVSVAAILGGGSGMSRSLVQMPGSALVMDLPSFRRAQREFPAFQETLLAYARAFLGQVMQSVACNGVHSVEERCARWLLMAHDRSDSDRFPLTQEFLAQMLGVSRPAVNGVARTLQRGGLIRYRRGEVSILDREGLEEASCECYGLMRRQYEDHLPPG
jgi:CRP-like cAMP-binding protein